MFIVQEFPKFKLFIKMFSARRFLICFLLTEHIVLIIFLFCTSMSKMKNIKLFGQRISVGTDMPREKVRISSSNVNQFKFYKFYNIL